MKSGINKDWVYTIGAIVCLLIISTIKVSMDYGGKVSVGEVIGYSFALLIIPILAAMFHKSFLHSFWKWVVFMAIPLAIIFLIREM